ncbi:hypothetical protein LIX60_26355 [Streptomyces sp. S07_1.15]|uniref:hypothetical protein n=1 Tax=Streptomyces sp. S07_1.15 TaxID=2873925 RepID=UPI001D13B907|nr:hypothetical protein [Streptomyces sp. S07_1.15]MCC3654926.1 hypothetical protein [Streptomyces sp. S07_1.15]
MPRRVSLPGADELFRTTGGTALQASSPASAREHAGGETAAEAPRVPAPAASGEDGEGAAGGDTARPEAAPEHGGRGAPAPRADAPERSAPSVPPVRPAGGRQQETGPASRTPAAAGAARRRTRAAGRRPSGRERHDEKITVYVSAEELMDLEHARLVLRGEHGLAVDRGRIVREAVAVVLADLESRGDASILVRRLRGS